MYDLGVLETEFLLPELHQPRKPSYQSPGAGEVTSGYAQRLDSLVRAQGRRYQRCLDGEHDYPSDSEASLAIVDPMVARHFTDAEIWQTLETSTLFQRRVEKKGERHAGELYASEIKKARDTVRPFDRDPGSEAVHRYERSHSEGKSGLPEVVVNNRHLRDLSTEGWHAINAGNEPPRLFQHGGDVADIYYDD